MVEFLLYILLALYISIVLNIALVAIILTISANKE